jgi:hypothetical protein
MENGIEETKRRAATSTIRQYIGVCDFCTVAENIAVHHGIEPCLTYLLGASDICATLGNTERHLAIYKCREELKRQFRDNPMLPGK